MAAIAPGVWVREGSVYKRRNRADRTPPAAAPSAGLGNAPLGTAPLGS